MNFDFFEICATLMGLVQGVLVLKNLRTNWIFYCLQYVFMCVFSIRVGLFGDTLSSVLYFFVGILGWILWGKDQKGKNRKITCVGGKERAIYIILSVICTLLGYFILRSSSDPLPFLDSMTTVLGIFATYYMVMRKVDSWVLWFIVDILYVLEYLLLPEIAWYLMALNCIWTLMAVGSFITWTRIAKGQKNEK